MLEHLGFTASLFFVINGWWTIGLRGCGTVTLVFNSGSFKVEYSFLCRRLFLAFLKWLLQILVESLTGKSDLPILCTHTFSSFLLCTGKPRLVLRFDLLLHPGTAQELTWSRVPDYLCGGGKKTVWSLLHAFRDHCRNVGRANQIASHILWNNYSHSSRHSTWTEGLNLVLHSVLKWQELMFLVHLYAALKGANKGQPCTRVWLATRFGMVENDSSNIVSSVCSQR